MTCILKGTKVTAIGRVRCYSKIEDPRVKRLKSRVRRLEKVLNDVSLFLTGPARMADMTELEGLICTVEAARPQPK